MAAIIFSPTLAAARRQLQRPGAGASAAAVAQPTAAVDEVIQISERSAEPIDAAGMPAIAEGGRPNQVSGNATESGAASADDLLARLRRDEAALAQRGEVLAAATAELARHQAELAAREQTLRADLHEIQEARKAIADETDAMKEAAERSGAAAGRERGEREARAAAQEQTERLNAIFHALQQSRRSLLDEQADMLVEIVFTAVCRLLGRYAVSRAGLESMVRSLVDNERELGAVTLRLHPDDARQLGAALEQFDGRLTVHADATVELGGCLLESARGMLDARLELQLQHLREALMLTRAQQRAAEVPV